MQTRPPDCVYQALLAPRSVAACSCHGLPDGLLHSEAMNGSMTLLPEVQNKQLAGRVTGAAKADSSKPEQQTMSHP